MNTNTDVYALCYCANFDLPTLQNRDLPRQACVAYRNVLHEEYPEGEVFIFDYGVLVFWGMSAEKRTEFVNNLHEFAKDPLTRVLDDEFTYEVGADKPAIKNDHLYLTDNAVVTRLAVSHGIAQSTKLAQFELQVQQTINDTAHIPKGIADTGTTHLSRKELAKLRGRLFIAKSNIMLNYDLLDVPDFFWEYPELDVYYTTVSDYLEVKQRVGVLTKKLETIHELFDMMADEQKHKHSSLLEWIIIWLIAFEIVGFLVHDIFKWL
jgi:uncharacterized Rmd1/YagE family protein